VCFVALIIAAGYQDGNDADALRYLLPTLSS
jgi:hypothetical protein